jgi:hypothetical protein
MSSDPFLAEDSSRLEQGLFLGLGLLHWARRFPFCWHLHLLQDGVRNRVNSLGVSCRDTSQEALPVSQPED